MGVKIGDAVLVCDEERIERTGLVTIVHGTGEQPTINVVMVSLDASKTDPYGRQVERLSSLQHYENGPSKMDHPGRYWK